MGYELVLFPMHMYEIVMENILSEGAVFFTLASHILWSSLFCLYTCIIFRSFCSFLLLKVFGSVNLFIYILPQNTH